MKRPSSALRAPSPRKRGEGRQTNLVRPRPAKRGEGGRRPGEGTFDKIRKLALSWPEVEEKDSHGSPGFFVKKRCFMYFVDNHHGDGNVGLWCNASEGGQEVLVGSDPDTFFIPPYVGCRGWVGVRVDRGLPFGAITDVVKDAYAATARAAASRRSSAKRRSRG